MILSFCMERDDVNNFDQSICTLNFTKFAMAEYILGATVGEVILDFYIFGAFVLTFHSFNCTSSGV